MQQAHGGAFPRTCHKEHVDLSITGVDCGRGCEPLLRPCPLGAEILPQRLTVLVLKLSDESVSGNCHKLVRATSPTVPHPLLGAPFVY